jgi:DNA-binding MarR family transcriptional regulator
MAGTEGGARAIRHEGVRPGSEVTHEPEHVAPDPAPARGQHIVIMLAATGRGLGEHIGSRLANADLASNVPVLILCELALRGPLRPRDLLGSTRLTSASMSKQLDHLEQLGLVERAFGTVKADRRASVVTLTPEGRRAAATIGEAVEDRLDDVVRMRDELTRLIGD